MRFAFDYACRVPIDLTRFERGEPFAGDTGSELRSLADRLGQLQRAQIVHRKRAIILFEGWLGSGKKAVLQRLMATFDPCQVGVHCYGTGEFPEEERHWLAAFWNDLPSAGRTSVFFRSWYRRALEPRVHGLVDERGWHRSLDEINEFESQQHDHGTVIVKLFFHVPADIQQERIRQRLADPWTIHLLTDGDLQRVRDRTLYAEHVQDLLDHTNTRWAPWTIIDAINHDAAEISALSAIATALEKGVPADPPEARAGAEIVDFPQQRRV